MDKVQLLQLYQAMVTAREIDRLEQEITSRGEAFFHVSGAGHESAVALAPHLTRDDWLHCHYRDKALMIARGVSARDFFDSLYCNDHSHSRGRQMSAHMSDRSLNLMSIVGPVGNSALQSVGVAAAVKDDLNKPIVLCSVGDGTTQEGEFLEAVAEAVRSELPVLFFVENNRWAISTETDKKTFYSLPHGQPEQFYGLAIHHVDGRHLVSAEPKLGSIISAVRETRGPALVVFEVDRLTSHTNADDQTIYRDVADIERSRTGGDPIDILEASLRDLGCSDEELNELRQRIVQDVAQAEESAALGDQPAAIDDAKRRLPIELTHPSKEVRGIEEQPQIVMRDAIRQVLQTQLRKNPRVTLWGEDIDDPKGDVFGITKGLGDEFGSRVQNSPLTESTIVGVSIGRALAGERPVAFLQFADFLPLAYNQIVSELGSMHWRTDGEWTAPVIIMVPCGGYRPGLGPFHAQSFESILTHTPGIDVFMPSTAADAAGMLNAAFKSQRPTVFLYPKSCLNDPAGTTSANTERQFIPIGTARKCRVGRDITLVGWGNTVRLCERAAEQLERTGVEAEVIDLRSLSPWDEKTVLASAEKTARLVVVHEDNHSCGVGAEILATVAETARVPVAVRRVTRPDTFVPCNFVNQMEVLPSLKRLLTTVADLLDFDLSWTNTSRSNASDGFGFVEAIGSGPSDETVEVVQLHVQVGDTIQRGDTVASLEATKSVFDLTSPISGTVAELIAGNGDTVAVGSPLLKIEFDQQFQRPKPITQEQTETPVFVRKRSADRLRVKPTNSPIRAFDVGISKVATVEGSRLISNSDLLQQHHGEDQIRHSINQMTSDDIVRRTGIQHRHWINDGEDAISLAVQASWQVLDREGLIPGDLDLVICSTTSPLSVTPSMACKVLSGLAGGSAETMAQAYDINAACSGYLYALQAGYDYLQSQPDGRVLIVTAEVLSPLLDPSDFDTAILFGDAASASVLYGETHFDKANGRLLRPDLSAKGDDDDTLNVPFTRDGYIQMKGRKVFTEAVRSMVASLNRVCEREAIAVKDLRMVVPHQANQRIIDAIENRVGIHVFSNIGRHGNTSSTSIPLCLDELQPSLKKGDRLGLCAFGGGFTFGAGIVETL